MIYFTQYLQGATSYISFGRFLFKKCIQLGVRNMSRCLKYLGTDKKTSNNWTIIYRILSMSHVVGSICISAPTLFLLTICFLLQPWTLQVCLGLDSPLECPRVIHALRPPLIYFHCPCFSWLSDYFPPCIQIFSILHFFRNFFFWSRRLKNHLLFCHFISFFVR